MTARRRCAGPWLRPRPDEGASHVVVEDGNALAAEPWSEQEVAHLVTTTGNEPIHLLVVERAGRAERAQTPTEPRQRSAARCDLQPQDPESWVHVPEHSQPAVRIARRMPERHAEVDGRPQADMGVADPDGPSSDLARRYVPGADDDRCARTQTGFERECACDPARDRRRRQHLGEELVGDADLGAGWPIPLPPAVIEEPKGGGAREVDHGPAGQSHHDRFLAVKQLRGVPEDLGALVPEPQDLGQDVLARHDRAELRELLGGGIRVASARASGSALRSSQLSIGSKGMPSESTATRLNICAVRLTPAIARAPPGNRSTSVRVASHVPLRISSRS